MKNIIESLQKQLTRLGLSSLFMLPIVSLGLLVGVIVLVILPRVPEVLSLYYSLQTEQVKQASLSDKVAKLEGINRDSYSTDLKELTKLLPDQEDYSGLVYSVTRFARASGLSVDDIKIDLLTKSSEHVRFEIDVRGRLESVNSFLTKMDSVKRIYIPESYELRKSDTDDEYVASFAALAPFEAPPRVLGELTSQIKEYSDEDNKNLSKIRSFSSYTFTEVTESAPVTTKSDPFEN